MIDIFDQILICQFVQSPNYKQQKNKKVIIYFMHMLKPTIISEISLKDRRTISSPFQFKHPNQQNKTIPHQPYKPYHSKYTNGIAISLKNSQNRQAPIQINSSFNSQQYFDEYMKKVIKSNLDKITQIRTEHQKQKQELFYEIKTLKTENTLLKSRLGQQLSQISKNQSQKSKQPSNSLQKVLQNRFGSQKILTQNPEIMQQSRMLIDEMKEKTERLTKQVQEYRKRNTILSLQKRNLNSNIQKLQKQFQLYKKQSQNKQKQLQELRNNEQNLKVEINEVKMSFQGIKKDNEVQKNKLLNQIQKLRQQRQKINVQGVIVQQNICKLSNDPRNGGVIDKRVLKHLQNRLKDRQVQLYEKNILIDDLNEKIIQNGLMGLNTRYKYLMKV